jgi:nucleoid DNA-binding protein
MGAKSDLARCIGDEYGLTYKLSNAIVGSVLDGIAAELKAGHKVVLAHFGTFIPKNIGTHQKTSHLTNETYSIPASRRVKFRPADSLRRL